MTWFSKKGKQMLPKDLLEDLEEGDRTAEFMTKDVDASSAEHNMPSGGYSTYPWGNIGMAQAMAGLANQQQQSINYLIQPIMYASDTTTSINRRI